MLALFSLAAAFVVPAPLAHSARALRVAAPSMVDIPRITLPDAVGGVLQEQDLNNPNDLSTTDYNTYSAAAIGGTLILFLLPLFDLLSLPGDLVFSALIGGGALAYLSLRKDDVGKYANQFGGYVMVAVDKVAEATPGIQDKVNDLIKQIKGD